MKNLTILILLISVILQSNDCIAQNSIVENKYIFKEGDFNGIGKWYMGREIAYVMGYQGIGWLERSEREKEENVSKLIKNMRIKPNDVIADIGAGSGYHAFRMASLAPNGLVYAVDIQTEMLMAIENKKTFSENSNIETILGTETIGYNLK